MHPFVREECRNLSKELAGGVIFGVEERASSWFDRGYASQAALPAQFFARGNLDYSAGFPPGAFSSPLKFIAACLKQEILLKSDGQKTRQTSARL